MPWLENRLDRQRHAPRGLQRNQRAPAALQAGLLQRQDIKMPYVRDVHRRIPALVWEPGLLSVPRGHENVRTVRAGIFRVLHVCDALRTARVLSREIARAQIRLFRSAQNHYQLFASFLAEHCLESSVAFDGTIHARGGRIFFEHQRLDDIVDVRHARIFGVRGGLAVTAHVGHIAAAVTRLFYHRVRPGFDRVLPSGLRQRRHSGWTLPQRLVGRFHLVLRT